MRDNPLRVNSPEEPAREAWNTTQCFQALQEALAKNLDCTILDYLDEEFEETLAENARSIARLTQAGVGGDFVKEILSKCMMNIIERFPEQLEDDLRISTEDEEYNRQLDAGEI